MPRKKKEDTVTMKVVHPPELIYKDFVRDHTLVPGVEYAMFGLVEEVGEVSQLFRKLHRNRDITKQEIALELGDVLFYVVAVANALDIPYEYILKSNVEKLIYKFNEKGYYPNEQLKDKYSRYVSERPKTVRKNNRTRSKKTRG